MGIARSKSVILTEKLKFKPKNEPCKDDCREEDDTVDSKKEDDIVDSCNKIHEASLFHGTHETQVSERGEADLDKQLVGCKKNPGHTQFVPVNDFNISHLPDGHKDNDLFEYIKAVANLTVRVGVEMTSTERPEFVQHTNQPYPFYDKRGSDIMRLGTGTVWNVSKLTNTEKCNWGTCQCHKCQNSHTPSNVWGVVRVYTATHVVFDDLEAARTSCKLFYDRQDSPVVTLNHWNVDNANIEEDRCVLKHVTCDLDLLDQLDQMARHRFDLFQKVTNKYKSSRDEVNLTFIVSHPHGCPKHISVGHMINRYKLSDDRTKYTYTTCTCPGSSGANVHSVGYNDGWYYDWRYYVRHVHSGVNSEGMNFSATGRELP